MKKLESYLLTKQQAAKYLNISVPSLERLRGNGLISIKVGSLVRFRPEDLSAYLDRQARRGKS